MRFSPSSIACRAHRPSLTAFLLLLLLPAAVRGPVARDIVAAAGDLIRNCPRVRGRFATARKGSEHTPSQKLLGENQNFLERSFHRRIVQLILALAHWWWSPGQLRPSSCSRLHETNFLSRRICLVKSWPFFRMASASGFAVLACWPYVHGFLLDRSLPCAHPSRYSSRYP